MQVLLKSEAKRKENAMLKEEYPIANEEDACLSETMDTGAGTNRKEDKFD